MFAIAFDLDTKSTQKAHPKGLTQACLDIGKMLQARGFTWRQGSVYTSQDENLAGLLRTMNAPKALPWFAASVRDIRAFRVEQWSDFTSFIKE